ncbi:translation initiation factor IF-2-like [Equus quagga]|uniref:translation initiation factor IF-2-like n=1 Tax=Equus quagga TaxID=89248 RepID=UPI001EE2CEE2|nr:translation initiation factor IF-2-like [Equus quagga]XP_046530204.1 translation initiation factor IF-2-like [Equus quagga]
MRPPPALLPGAARRPPPAASLSLGSARRPAPRPDRPRLPPHPGAGNAAAGARGPAQAAPLVAASLPHLNRPRPSPQGPARGRAAATGLHNPAGDGGRGGGGPGAAAPPQCWGPGDGPRGSPATRLRRAESPRHPSPSAPPWAGVGDRNRLPTWRTGSGPARRREHSSRAGSGGAGPGRPPREEPREQTAGSGCQKERLGVERTRKTRGPSRPPRRGTPRPQGPPKPGFTPVNHHFGN